MSFAVLSTVCLFALVADLGKVRGDQGNLSPYLRDASNGVKEDSMEGPPVNHDLPDFEEDNVFWSRLLDDSENLSVTPEPTPTPSPNVPPTNFPTRLDTPPPNNFPTIPPTPLPDTATPTIQLCSDNIPVTVSVGPNSNPSGGFVNVPTQQSLANVIDCLALDQGEQHNQQSHVWWNPGPLELLFDFDGTEYDLQAVYFWNYFGEQFDVDQIDFQFFNANNELVNTQTVLPRRGQNAQGNNDNDIVAERLDLTPAVRASFVAALVIGTNGEIDFQNFVFVGTAA